MTVQKHMVKLIVGILLIVTQSCVSQNRSVPPGIDLTASKPKFGKALKGAQANIYWLGEQHGTRDNYKVALAYFEYLLNEVGIDYLIIENSYLTEVLLNTYLQTGDEAYLVRAITNYSGTFYANQELKCYLESIDQLWQQRPADKKFRFVAIDIEQTYRPSETYIHDFLKRQGLREVFKRTIDFDSEKDNHSRRKYYALLQSFLKERNLDNDTIPYMVKNMQHVLTAYIHGETWDKVRDSLIYENFKRRDKELHFKRNTGFAFWGTDHCYQAANKKGVKWIASLIGQHHPELKQNSTVILYEDCAFMSHKGKFPKLSRFLFKKIDDNFIRHTFQNEPFQKLQDKRLLKKNKVSTITMWPVKDLPPDWDFVTKKMDGKRTRDYMDNVVLMVNSGHCTPFYAH
ncbi:MAG: hypothetical protein AB3N16_06385 [Flavobacteriaceae bacterium]